MSEVHTLTGAAAVNALPVEEAAFFDRHIAVCVSCRQEAQELAATAATVGATCAEQPPARLRRRVLADIDLVRQLPPADASPSRPRLYDRRWIRPLLGGVAGVLAVAVAGLAGTTVQLNERIADLEAATPAGGLDGDALAVLAAPDIETVTLGSTQGASVRLVYSPSRDQAVFVASGMDALAPDATYELWLFHDDTPQPATLFEPDDHGRVLAVVDGQVTGAQAAAVTIEPHGGSPRPTGDIIAHGSV